MKGGETPVQGRFTLRIGFLIVLLVLGIGVDGIGSRAWARAYVGWAAGDVADGYGTILYTDDGGDSWVRQGSPGDIPNADLASVSAASATTAWVVGKNSAGYATILRTGNRGQTWERQGSPATVPNVELLKVKAVNAYVAWAVGFQGTVLRTINGGKTWEQVNKAPIPDVQLQGLDALDANTAWASGVPYNGEGAVFHTTDGGATWTKQGSTAGVPADSHFLGISGADADHVWAVGGGGLLVIHSQDGGGSWAMQSGSVGQQNDANEVDALDRHTAWVAQDYDNILLTLNGGKTWINRAPNPVTGRFMMGVSSADANTAWVVGSSGLSGGIIVRTTDGGLSWDRKTPPSPEGETPPNLWGISIVPRGMPSPALLPLLLSR
jgi:photosystem II stability/assembly factor-like uncharacterized protein